MTARNARFTAKELSSETLPDFERLLETHPAPGAYPCWCLYNHRTGPPPESEPRLSRAQQHTKNRQDKAEMVAQGCSHGILVYAKGEPVGWCQYGSSNELPRIDRNPGYRKYPVADDSKRLWRITCFVVDRRYRGQGVAATALKAALKAIKQKGGGIVEAFPITRWGAYADFRGTVSMFEKQGFEIVAPLGKDNALMRRSI